MYRILLLCKDHSALSPMAHGFFNLYAGNFAEIYSAGIEKQFTSPLVIKLMEEVGLDITKQLPHEIGEFSHIDFDYILTFDKETEEESHHFPSRPIKYHFYFEELNNIPELGAHLEIIYKSVQGKIKRYVKAFVKDHILPIDDLH